MRVGWREGSGDGVVRGQPKRFLIDDGGLVVSRLGFLVVVQFDKWLVSGQRF